MAIVVEAATNQTFTAAATDPVTFSYTMTNSSSGANRLLVIAHFGDNLTGATYNGQALANVASVNLRGHLMYIVDANLPTDGLAHDIVLTFGANRTNQDILILEVSGATQTVPGSVNAEMKYQAAADPHTLDVTPDADAAAIFLFYLRVEDRTMSSQPSGTHHFSSNTGTINDGKRITQVVGPTPAALTTYTWDPSSSSTFRAYSIELSAAGGGGGGAAKAYYYSQLQAA